MLHDLDTASHAQLLELDTQAARVREETSSIVSEYHNIVELRQQCQLPVEEVESSYWNLATFVSAYLRRIGVQLPIDRASSPRSKAPGSDAKTDRADKFAPVSLAWNERLPG